ncbi:MAG: FHA domain-containing protein [Eubacterium sp.]|nr:FHA domain-containing protein [Eubacterium sp.]
MFIFGKKDYFKPGPDGKEPVLAFVSKTMTVPVYDVPAVIGREPSQVDVVINDATVSRKHLYIGTYENKITATDQGSTVGTIINGETLEPGIPYYLSEGDKVTIGKLSFVSHLNKERTGKKLKLPSFIQKETAGDTSEMDKADIAAAAKTADAAAGADEALQDAAENELEPAAEIVKDAEMASEPVIKLMPDPAAEEQDEETEEHDKTEDPVSELESMGLEFGDEEAEEDVPYEAPAEDNANEAPAEGNVSVPDDKSEDLNEEEPDEEPDEEPASEETETPPETIEVLRGGRGHQTRAKFVYYSGHTAVETFEITATPFVIGRAKSDYTPGAAGVSRRHCFIDRISGIYYITDLESTNGVWINGRKIKPYNRTALESGDIVGIGDRVYKFEIE